MARRVTHRRLFKAIKETSALLPPHERIAFIKDIGDVITKYTGGKVGRVGFLDIEMWSFGKTPLWERIFSPFL